MKRGDLVRLKNTKEKDDVGIILDIRVSDTDFHDVTRSKPYIYANILWGKVPNSFRALSSENNTFELSVDVLEVVK